MEKLELNIRHSCNWGLIPFIAIFKLFVTLFGFCFEPRLSLSEHSLAFWEREKYAQSSIQRNLAAVFNDVWHVESVYCDLAWHLYFILHRAFVKPYFDEATILCRAGFFFAKNGNPWWTHGIPSYISFLNTKAFYT